jgi:hypothetical protein
VAGYAAVKQPSFGSGRRAISTRQASKAWASGCVAAPWPAAGGVVCVPGGAAVWALAGSEERFAMAAATRIVAVAIHPRIEVQGVIGFLQQKRFGPTGVDGILQRQQNLQ